MGKIFGLTLVLVLAVFVMAAGAADIEGTIKQVDSQDRSIVLEDGTKLWMAEGLGMDQLKEGAKVKASYEQREGKNVVTSIQVSE